MGNRLKRYVLVPSLLTALALISCGGAPTSQQPAPYSGFLVWVDVPRLWISQGSSEAVAVGACAPAPCSGPVPPIGPTPVPPPAISVQVAGLPNGVAASPASFVIPQGGALQPLTFSVSASAAPGNVTLTLTGTSGTQSYSFSLPLTVAPASPPGSPTCADPNPPPPSTPSPAPGEWTWESGADTYDQPGIYGTQGVPSATNVPGARVGPSGWTDSSGNFWLFGGYGAGYTAAQGDLNDLWKYSGNQWTWMGGANVTEQPGVYGTLGVPAPGDVPGARQLAASWTDASGNFWLFGGTGLDSNGTGALLNDLWKYDPATAMWTWMGGPKVVCNTGGNSACPGVYGAQGVPAPESGPGSRFDAASWTDSCGNLWLFGGSGFDSIGWGGSLSDLWRYDPATNLWTWTSGANIVDQNGTYGTLGQADPGNIPGSRTNPVTWIDRSGDLWLFGGWGADFNGILCEDTANCYLNDLWKYDPATNTWTWMGGPNVSGQPGVYGTQGTPAPGNMPGGRDSALSWTDPQGNFWLFAGEGLDSRTNPEVYGDLNDLWKYDPATNMWTWMSGANLADQPANYGTLGTAAPGNVPPSRMWAVGWTDKSGNLWLFGGFNMYGQPSGKFNDLWKYQP